MHVSPTVQKCTMPHICKNKCSNFTPPPHTTSRTFKILYHPDNTYLSSTNTFFHEPLKPMGHPSSTYAQIGTSWTPSGKWEYLYRVNSFDGHPFDGHPFDGHPLMDTLLMDTLLMDTLLMDTLLMDTLLMDPFDGHPFDGHPFDGHPFDGHPLMTFDGHPFDGHPFDGHPCWRTPFSSLTYVLHRCLLKSARPATTTKH